MHSISSLEYHYPVDQSLINCAAQLYLYISKGERLPRVLDGLTLLFPKKRRRDQINLGWNISSDNNASMSHCKWWTKRVPTHSACQKLQLQIIIKIDVWWINWSWEQVVVNANVTIWPSKKCYGSVKRKKKTNQVHVIFRKTIIWSTTDKPIATEKKERKH
jgi:hypothetical protein